MARRRTKPRDSGGVQGELPLSHQLAILDARNEQAFDRILGLTADVFGATTCCILVQEGGRHWTKMRGMKTVTSERPSAGTFIQHTLLAENTFFVADAAADPRFCDHPRVAGGPRIRSYFGAPLITESGRPVGALAVMSDTPRDPPTEVQQRLLCHFADYVMTQIGSRAHQYVGEQLRLSEARLHRSEQHLAQAQRLADVGSAELDLVTHEHYCSEGIYRIFGLPAGAPMPSIEEMIRDIIHPDDRERVTENHRRLMRGGPVQCEYRIRRPDGTERAVVRYGEMVFGDGKPRRFVMAIQDVTELRKAEKARDDYREQLHHAQRLDALGTLAGGIAHDLNNTLVPILALTKLMRAEARSEDDRRNLEVIHHAGERARDLVRQVLAFSRKMPTEHHRIDLSELVANTLRLMRAGIDARISVTERLAPGAMMYADPGQMHQVVVNLVTNAAQAIGDRAGTIAVTLEPGSGEAASLRLTVVDDGGGMEERTLSRMFEPFFTTRSVGSGAGLGLSIVHGIVTGHGGSIVANSSPGNGTRITIDLPSYERRTNAALTIAAA